MATAAISSHVASRTSPDRAAVNTRNSKASFVPVQARDARTTATASATSSYGSAVMCRTTFCCRPSAWPRASPAGLSGRCCIATAHFMTAPMR